MMVKLGNDGLLQANDGKLLVDDCEMIVKDGKMTVCIIDEHFTSIYKHYTIISLK